MTKEVNNDTGSKNLFNVYIINTNISGYEMVSILSRNREKLFIDKKKLLSKFQLRLEQQLRHERLAINLWKHQKNCLKENKMKG